MLVPTPEADFYKGSFDESDQFTTELVENQRYTKEVFNSLIKMSILYTKSIYLISIIQN